MRLSSLAARTNLWLRVSASSGSALVGYHAFPSYETPDDDEKRRILDRNGNWSALIELTPLLKGPVDFFYPFTTTLVELRVNREPLPIETGEKGLELCWWMPGSTGVH